MKPEWKLSASCIAAYKACPTRFRLAYREGLRPAEDTEALRVGSNWHSCLEIAQLKADQRCICFARSPGLESLTDSDCPLCGGMGFVIEANPLYRVTDWLDKKYKTIPANVDRETWKIEQIILLYSIAGWLWYYQNDDLETIATEVQFNLPFRNPTSNRALPHVSLVGKIDRIVKRDGQVLNLEAKSTTKSIASDSSYWDRLNLDTQVSTYVHAARRLDYPIASTLYDVWHKPGIKPKKLTQAESKAFVETGEYFGQKFKVVVTDLGLPGEAYGGPGSTVIEIDNQSYAVLPGKKSDTFALRETPEMFGARLLADIYERPDFYFARREIARTDDDLRAFSGELYHIYKSMRSMEKFGYWFRNEQQCEATFKCPYAQICYHNMEVCDGKTTPPGFRRIFDLETRVTEED